MLSLLVGQYVSTYTLLIVHIWSLIDILREAESHPEKAFNLNRILVDKMIDSVIQLNNICSDKIGTLHARIHPLTLVGAPLCQLCQYFHF